MIGIALAPSASLRGKSDIVRAIFRDATPGFSVIVEQAIRANEAALGPELVVNGDFAAGTAGWSANNSASLSVLDGRLLVQAVGSSYGGAVASIPTAAGKAYRLSGARLGGTAATAWILAGTSFGANNLGTLTLATSGALVFVATSAVTYITAQNSNTPADSNSIYDNISVREIDLSRCQAFQDGSGTVPVTAMEQPLGLLLDVSRGLVRGADWLPGGWTGSTLGSGASVNAGVLTLAGAPTGYAAFKDGSIAKSNTWYEATVSWSGLTGACGLLYQGVALAGLAVGSGSAPVKFNSGTVANGRVQLNNNTGSPVSGTVTISVRELPGNHLVQPSNTTSRPIVRRRVNLLNGTNSFATASWNRTQGGGVSVGTGIVAAGFALEKLTANAVSGEHVVYQDFPPITGAAYTQTYAVKAAERTTVGLLVQGGSFPNGQIIFNLLTGTVVSNTSSAVPFIRARSEGVFLVGCSLTASGGAGSAVKPAVLNAASELTYIGDGVSGVYVGAPDLRLTADTLNLSPYQRVTSATDYDETGFPAYAEYDGVDDWLEHAEIDFTGTDSMTLCAGVVTLQDTGSWGMLYELSWSTDQGTGQVALSKFIGSSGSYNYRSRGTTSSDSMTVGMPAPHKGVFTGQSKISTDSNTLRVNGTQVASNAADQGTGNYGKHKGYIGRRDGTSLPAKMRFYGLTVVGKTLTDAQRDALEREHNRTIKAY